jgi:hypothetical protein
MREDFILKQRTLYELAGLDDSHYLVKNPTQEMQIEYEEANVMQDDDNSQDFETVDIGFETVEDGQIFEDEQMEEGEFISEEAEEDEAANAVIKIEKVHGGEETLGSDFDFFEEIVGEDEEGGEESLLVESGDIKVEL